MNKLNTVNNKDNWPRWLPKGCFSSWQLTDGEYAYILPVFNTNKTHTVDHCTLLRSKKRLSGLESSLRTFKKKRFAFFYD